MFILHFPSNVCKKHVSCVWLLMPLADADKVFLWLMLIKFFVLKTKTTFIYILRHYWYSYIVGSCFDAFIDVSCQYLFSILISAHIFVLQSAVMSSCFAKFHPNLVVGGTYSGQIVLWDNRVLKRTPIQRTPLSAAAHTVSNVDF